MNRVFNNFINLIGSICSPQNADRKHCTAMKAAVTGDVITSSRAVGAIAETGYFGANPGKISFEPL